MIQLDRRKDLSCWYTKIMLSEWPCQ